MLPLYQRGHCVDLSQISLIKWVSSELGAIISKDNSGQAKLPVCFSNRSVNMGFWLEKMNLIGLDFICFFDIKAGKRYLFHEKIAGKTPNFQEKSWKTVIKNSGNHDEISSCINTCMIEHLNHIENITLFCDNCSGQNKNRLCYQMMSIATLYGEFRAAAIDIFGKWTYAKRK